MGRFHQLENASNDDYLSESPPCDRFLKYAALIRALDMDGIPAAIDLSALQDAYFLGEGPSPFKVLHSVYIFLDGEKDATLSWARFVSFALVSNLNKFVCTATPSPLFLLKQMLDKSPSLSSLSIFSTTPVRSDSKSQLASVLQKFRSLKYVNLELVWLQWDVLLALSSLPAVTSLTLHYDLELPICSLMSSHIIKGFELDAFPNLTSLDISAEERRFTCFYHMSSYIRHSRS